MALKKFLSPKLVCKSRTASDVIDVKAGNIFVHSSANGASLKSKLFMTVFKNTYEHHAQIYTDDHCKYMYGSISLRKCVVQLRGVKQITVTSGARRINDVTQGLSFEAYSHEDALEWIEALTPSADLCPDSEFSPLTPKRTFHSFE